MLTFHVEDQLHHRMRTFNDDADNAFLRLVRRYGETVVPTSTIIDSYCDTMFNFKQLDRLTVELEELLRVDELTTQERARAAEVLSAVREARGESGYLFVVGD